MELTNQQRKENALNELKALGYFGFSYWGQGDIELAYGEINEERAEDSDELPELTAEQKERIIGNFEHLVLVGEEPTFGDLKIYVKAVYEP